MLASDEFIAQTADGDYDDEGHGPESVIIMTSHFTVRGV